MLPWKQLIGAHPVCLWNSGFNTSWGLIRLRKREDLLINISSGIKKETTEEHSGGCSSWTCVYSYSVSLGDLKRFVYSLKHASINTSTMVERTLNITV